MAYPSFTRVLKNAGFSCITGRCGLISLRMSELTHPSNERSLIGRFLAAPLELRMYTVFATAATVVGYGLAFFGPKSLNRAIVPFTGWSAGSYYAFTLFFAFGLVFAKKLPQRPQLAGAIWRFAIIAILLLGIFAGYLNMRTSGGDNFGNPYLRISPAQPVWTMIIPAFWIMMLLSPRINRFYKSQESK